MISISDEIDCYIKLVFGCDLISGLSRNSLFLELCSYEQVLTSVCQILWGSWDKHILNFAFGVAK